MRRLSTTYRSILAAMFALFVLAGPAYAGTKSWQISESSGAVSVETGNGVVTATRGMSLKSGDAVSTGASGRAVIVRGEEYVIVSPKSRIRITKPQETGAVTQIFQSVGSVLFKIKKKETPHFGVKTPYLAAVVKGTTFNVTVTPEGAVVQVTEGKVEVSTLDGGASDMIVPGRIGRVDANDRQLLKVLGTNERSIRSPLPPVDGEAAVAGDVSDEPTSDEKTASSKKDDSQPVSVGSGEATKRSSDADHNANTGFSGRIGSPIASEPVSLAVVTGGLISNSQAIDRGQGNGNGASASTGDTVAVGSTNGNGSASTGGTVAVGSTNGSGSGNVDGSASTGSTVAVGSSNGNGGSATTGGTAVGGLLGGNGTGGNGGNGGDRNGISGRPPK